MDSYKNIKMYLEGLIIILESLETKEDPTMNIGILTDIHKVIGKLIVNLQASGSGRA